MMAQSRFFDTTLDEVSMKNALKQIGENADSRARSSQKLKENILRTENLNSCLDDSFLLRFLRVAKFDYSKAYDRLHRYYFSRKKYPHIFHNFYPSATTSAQSAHHLWASPMRADDNSAVIIHKKGLFNPSTMIFEEMFLLDLIIIEYLADNSITQVCGLTTIIDFDGYGMQHLMQDTPKRIKIALDSFQNTFPVRFRDIHIVNAPQVFSFVYNLAYPFLSKKIRNRVHIHRNQDDIVSFLRAEILPEEYGGKIPKSDLIDLVDEVIRKEEYYRDQLQYGYLKNS